MDSKSRVFHFIGLEFVAGNDTLAREEFEAVQKYIRSPDSHYRHEGVAYVDFWKKIERVKKPNLLHIVAHGKEGQLLTADAYLKYLGVDAYHFARETKNHLGDVLKYVYLGVCDSVGLAQALTQEGYTVLCFEGKVAPEKGVYFAKKFYQFHLEKSKDFYAAYTAAKTSWKSNGFDEKGVVPRFYCADSSHAPQFVWQEERYKALLEKLRSAKKPHLLETLFDELQLDSSKLQPLNFPEVYRYLKKENALFRLRDSAEAYFLEYQHLYEPDFMDLEDGLLEPYLKPPPPREIQKQNAISGTALEYKRRFGGIVGAKTLTSNGLELLAKSLVFPMNLDYNRIKAHLLDESPSLKVSVKPDGENGSPMSPKQFLPWLLKNKKRFFVLQGAAGSGKTTFLVDTVREHFLQQTTQEVFIARFSEVEKLEAQLTKWEKDAIGNILILDALDELYEGNEAILKLLSQKDNPVRSFSKVVVCFRDTFLSANETLQETINQEDWNVLRIAPLQFSDVERYLREHFPLHTMQEAYGNARRFIKAGETMPPELRQGVTPFLLFHIQFLLEEPSQDGPITYWDVMSRLVDKSLEKGMPGDREQKQKYRQIILDLFKKKVLQAYHSGDLYKSIAFSQGELEDLEINEYTLRNFSFLRKLEPPNTNDDETNEASSKNEKEIVTGYIFSHSNFKDYFLALLLFEGRIRELDFDKTQYADAYRLYQDYCWKQIAPKGPYRHDWDDLIASALPCFAFQVIVRKHGGALPIRYPSLSKYFREAFKDWDEGIWKAAIDLAVRRTEGEGINQMLNAIEQQNRTAARALSNVLDFKDADFLHPLYHDVFAFLRYQEQGREAALDFLDESAFAWLFRHERNWLEYGEQAEAYSLVYPVKDNGSAYDILLKDIGVDESTDFDQKVFTALQAPAMLERYYETATRLHVQVHAATLPAHLLESILFPEQLEELSIGSDVALTGDWNLRAFENLDMLDLSAVDIGQLRLNNCPSLLKTIIHPQADRLPINNADSRNLKRETDQIENGWFQQVPDIPIPPDLVEVVGGAFEMGEGWFEAVRAFMKEQMGRELPDDQRFRFPSYQALVDTFYMAKYPVTVGEFARFVRATGYRTRAERYGFAFATHVYQKRRGNKSNGMRLDYLLPGLHWRHSVWGDVLLKEESADLPVVYISYEDANAYAQWLTDIIGDGGVYRLPAEAEWEYAARGGRQSKGYIYAGSDNINEVAQYLKKEPEGLRRVGAAYHDEMDAPNEIGLYDMSGNVWEWCRDWSGQVYYAHCKAEEPVFNPTGPESGSHRVVRGGSWDGIAANCQVASRFWFNPGFRSSGIGFRLVFVP